MSKLRSTNYLRAELYQLIKSDESIFEFLQEGSLDGIWYWDLENPENEWMSDGFWKLFGYSAREKEHLSSEWQDMIHPDDLKLAQENFMKHCADPNFPYDQLVRYQHKNGKTIWVRCRGVAIRDKSGKPVRMLGAHNDFTELKNMEFELKALTKKLEQLAHFDVVTHLPNRTYFKEILSTTLARAKRTERLFAVLFIDVDNFKDINDSYSHDVGDKVLTQVGERLAQVSRKMDHVFRHGGDEFIAIVDDIKSSKDAAAYAEKVLSLFRNNISIDGLSLKISLSIGISMYPASATTEEDLLRCADTAMYNAKKEGKDTYKFYTERFNEENNRRLKIEAALQTALSNAEFSLVYQPMLNLETEACVGYEVLLRWHSASLGKVTPDEFIPIAESSGMMDKIGRWVIKTAIERYCSWSKQANKLDVFINLNCSAVHLRDKKFADYIKSVVQEYQINPQNLILETTETALHKNMKTAQQQLESLTSIGIKIAIDDFGTGYSSLSHIKKLPISILKIDKSFVEELPNDRSNAAICKAIISLGQALEFEVVAEGIETEAQNDWLVENNCRLGQGYYFEKPISEEAFIKFFDEGGVTS